jgi:hypothetical protein
VFGVRLLPRRRRKLRQVIGLVGLPRSGTTLLASMLGTHSRINAIFEPWNISANLGQAQVAAERGRTLDDFIACFGVKMSRKQDVLLIKETGTALHYINNLASLLSSVSDPVTPGVVVIIRNPIHAYLSEIDARKKWWGADHLVISPETFDSWASRSLCSLLAIKTLAERFDGVVISYEKLTKSPVSVGRLLRLFGLRLEPQQINYEKHVGHLQIAGDRGLEKDPQPVSDGSVSRRAIEFDRIRPMISGARHFGAIVELAEWTDWLKDAEPRRGIMKSVPVGGRSSSATVSLFVPAGPFYSPIVAPAEVAAMAASEQNGLPAALADVKLDVVAMERLWNELAPTLAVSDLAAAPRPDRRYNSDNGLFSCGDAMMLRAMIVRHQPRHMIQVGSGFHSAVILDTLEELADGTVSITCIEPRPDTLMPLLRADDMRWLKLMKQPLRDVSLEIFDELGPSDILLVDSAHVLKAASNVTHLLGGVLPRLRAGVIIHFHDVFYPFEYPGEWVVKDARSWNELHALRAFLAYNSSFEVMFFNDYFRKLRQSLIEGTAKAFLQGNGSSLWLRRTLC